MISRLKICELISFKHSKITIRSLSRNIDRTVITAKYIVPVDLNREDIILENHAIAIKDGRIIDILPKEEANRKYLNRSKLINLGEKVCIPGLINSHTRM